MRKLAAFALLIPAVALAAFINIGGNGRVAASGGGGGGNRLVGDEWFATNMDASGDGPLWGFDSQTVEPDGGFDNDYITFSHSATGGPANRAYVREVINYPTAPSEFGHNWYWTADGSGHVGWNGTRVIRYSFRFVSGEGNQEQKVVQFNRGDEGNDRFVLTFEDITSPTASIVVMQRNGGEDSTPYPVGGATSMGVGTGWFHIQIELHYSSALDVADGSWKLWVNNDTYASPSRSGTGLILNTSSSSGTPDYLSWCGIHQVITAARTIEWADVRVGPTFDSNWAASGT